jgi:LAS superfamily LD-carboxypeptidase LdcB
VWSVGWLTGLMGGWFALGSCAPRGGEALAEPTAHTSWPKVAAARPTPPSVTPDQRERAVVPATERKRIVVPQPARVPAHSDIRVPDLDCKPIAATGYRRGRKAAITVVTIDDDMVERSTADAYWAMRAAAAKDGVELIIYSGFRTPLEQEYFYRCYRTGKCNGGVKAAKPGWSNHQSGKALDISVSDALVHPWLVANAARFGFEATVPSEPWHWEFQGTPKAPSACKARKR